MTDRAPPLAGSTAGGVMAQVAMLAAAAVVAWTIAWERPGRADAVGFAVTVCLAGILGGWAARRWQGTTPAARVSATLAVVALRIFPALAALGWLQGSAAAGLREAGAGEVLVACYLVVLATEIVRTIIDSRGGGPQTGPTQVN